MTRHQKVTELLPLYSSYLSIVLKDAQLCFEELVVFVTTHTQSSCELFGLKEFIGKASKEINNLFFGRFDRYPLVVGM